MWAKWDSTNNEICVGPQNFKPDSSSDWIVVDKQYDVINLETHKAQTTYNSETNTITIVKVEKTTSELNQLFLHKFKSLRNTLLFTSDWTQATDSPLTDSKKAEWVTYRQALRDLPANYPSATSIDDVTFPTEPS